MLIAASVCEEELSQHCNTSFTPWVLKQAGAKHQLHANSSMTRPAAFHKSVQNNATSGALHQPAKSRSTSTLTAQFVASNKCICSAQMQRAFGCEAQKWHQLSRCDHCTCNPTHCELAGWLADTAAT